MKRTVFHEQGCFGKRDGLAGWMHRAVGWCLFSHKAELFIQKECMRDMVSPRHTWFGQHVAQILPIRSARVSLLGCWFPHPASALHLGVRGGMWTGMTLLGRFQTCTRDMSIISGVSEYALTCDIAPTCETNGSSRARKLSDGTSEGSTALQAGCIAPCGGFTFDHSGVVYSKGTY